MSSISGSSHILGDEHLPKNVSFVYIDCDFYEPVKAALEYLRKVVTAGSVITVDDFTTEPKIAVGEWLRDTSWDGQTYDVFVFDARLGDFVHLTRRM